MLGKKYTVDLKKILYNYVICKWFKMKLKSVGCSDGKIFLYLDPDFLRFLLFFIILSLIWFYFVGKLRPFCLRLVLLYLFHAQNFPISCFHVMTYFVYLTLTLFHIFFVIIVLMYLVGIFIHKH